MPVICLDGRGASLMRPRLCYHCTLDEGLGATTLNKGGRGSRRAKCKREDWMLQRRNLMVAALSKDKVCGRLGDHQTTVLTRHWDGRHC